MLPQHHLFPLNEVYKHGSFFSFWFIHYRVLKASNSMGLNRCFSKQWMERTDRKKRATYFTSKFKLIVLDQRNMRDGAELHFWRGRSGVSLSYFVCKVCVFVCGHMFQLASFKDQCIHFVLYWTSSIAFLPDFLKEDCKYMKWKLFILSQCLLFYSPQCKTTTRKPEKAWGPLGKTNSYNKDDLSNSKHWCAIPCCEHSQEAQVGWSTLLGK